MAKTEWANHELRAEDDVLQKHSFRIGCELHGERLDRALPILCKNLSRKKAKALVDQGSVYHNRKRCVRANRELCEGDTVEFFLGATESLGRRPRLIPADLLFFDDELLVLTKPAGLPSQASLVSARGTVIEALREDLNVDGDLHLVHRLDKDTSGLLILARNQESRAALDAAFQKGQIQKTYLALLCSVLSSPRGEINAPIIKETVGFNRYRAAQDGERRSGARSAMTGFVQLDSSDAFHISLVQFKPKTGRTHQIRVHAAHVLGAPILGDRTYGTQVLGHPLHAQTPRHMLHAWRLGFQHPASRVWLNLEAPLPKDFRELSETAGLEISGGVL